MVEDLKHLDATMSDVTFNDMFSRIIDRAKAVLGE